jgi:hypothetical protein
MTILVKIGKVDFNGYCGREPHPAKWMEGQTGILIALRLTTELEDVISEEDITESENERVFTVQIGGHLYDLMEHEIERTWTEVGS